MPRPPFRARRGASAPDAGAGPRPNDAPHPPATDPHPPPLRDANVPESGPSQPAAGPAPEDLQKDPGLQAAVDPHKLPPRITLLPADYILCLLIPAPMYAYHCGDRRFIWPVTLCEFAALCFWFGGTVPLFANDLLENKETFVWGPIKRGWDALKELPNLKWTMQTVFGKKTAVLAAVVLHLAVIGAAMWRTFTASRRQKNAVYVMRPVHWSDFALLVVDDTVMLALHVPSRASLALRSVMRVVLLFGFLPHMVVGLVVPQAINCVTLSNAIRLMVHVGMAGFFLSQHMKAAGMTSIF